MRRHERPGDGQDRGRAPVDAAVLRAVERRAPLAGDPGTTAYRLVNGAADGLPGVAVDRFGSVLVINLYDQPSAATERRQAAVLEALSALPEVAAIYVKRRPRTAARLLSGELDTLAPAEPAWGRRTDEVVVMENGLRFLIRPGAGLSTGLFLDMRELRGQIRSLAADRDMLNLFAYTCAFGVAASSGGARRVLNLDAARPALRWGMENYALNGLAADPYDFVYGDAFDWLHRLARRGTRFEIVIADPPSFSTVKGRRFDASRDYGGLAAACARIVAPCGTLALCSNEAALSRAAFRAACLAGVKAAERSATLRSEETAPAIDFPSEPGAEGYLKVLLLELN